MKREARNESRFRRRPPAAHAEKGVSREQLIRTVEEAIQSAYRRTPGDEDIHVRIDAESGKVRVFRARFVAEEIEDPTTQISVADAQAFQPGAEPGDLVETEQLDQEAFGRIHAQTAKQVVLQRLHEAERNVVFDHYASSEGELMTGTVSRIEPRAIILDVGKAEAILATTEQSPLEHYRIGQNVKAFVLEVRRSAKGPQIYVSRTHKGFLRRLFELECRRSTAAPSRSRPSLARRAAAPRWPWRRASRGSIRSERPSASVARGSRPSWPSWAGEDRRHRMVRGRLDFRGQALSPAQVIEVRIDEEHRIANVVVPERMLSLAIGREGQNARLAAKLTGWRIDIRSDVSVAEAARVEAAHTAEAAAAESVEEIETAAVATAKRRQRRRPRSRPQTSRSWRSPSGERRPRRLARPSLPSNRRLPRRCRRSPGRATTALSDPVMRRLPPAQAEA